MIFVLINIFLGSHQKYLLITGYHSLGLKFFSMAHALKAWPPSLVLLGGTIQK
jgi:hypothetical protein